MPSPSLAAGGRRSTAELLIATAERLIAERGVQGVSLRRIAVEAGQHNAGVTQYHFGSLEGLLDAILRARLPTINARRHELLAELALAGDGDDLRGLVEALVLPMAEVSENSPYVAFLARLLEYRAGFAGMAPTDEALVSGAVLVGQRIQAVLAHLSPDLVQARYLAANAFMIQILGLRYRATAHGEIDGSWLITVADLVDMLTAAVAAPSTARSRR